MPTLMDAEQQAFAGEAAPDMSGALAGAPGGGSDPGGLIPPSVPQSDRDAIARRLLGDEMTDRYGDALGLRKETWKDFFRDMGNELGRTGNADRVKQRVVDQYRQREQDERAAAQQRDEEDRAKLGSFINLVKTMKDIPKGHRQGILKAGAAKLGMEGSPEVVKLLADVENFDSEAVLTPELVQMLFENPQQGIAELSKVVSDPEALIALSKGISQMGEERKRTQNMILEQDRAKERDERETVTNLRSAVAAELTARQNGLASAEQPVVPFFKGKTDEELQALALQNPSAKAESPFDALMREAVGGKAGAVGPSPMGSKAAPPKVTVRKKTAGIPQE